MPIVYPYIQYGGVWTLQQQMQAQGAANWPGPPKYLYSWGYNGHGELGLGNTTEYHTAVNSSLEQRVHLVACVLIDENSNNWA